MCNHSAERWRMERRSSGGRFLVEDPSPWLPYLSVAFCVLLLPLALIGDRRRGEPRVFTAGTTGILTLRLPDGSRATLINGGTIQFRDDFVRRRRAWVFGQAMLDVLPGPTLSLWTETAFISTTGDRSPCGPAAARRR